MATTGDIADFVLSVDYDGFDSEVRTELKKRVLDSIGIAIGALGEDPVEAVDRTVRATNGGDVARLWGRDARASVVGAAMHNTALTRYLDYMDSFLAPGETPHPSDNLGSVAAVAEERNCSGEQLLAGLGTAYEIQAELAWNAPVRDEGFDHVTHTVISAAAGAGHVAGLDRERLRNAIGIAGTAHNALRVTRTGGINEWKGLASANAARNAVYSVELAANGVEGPVDLFEGQKGWQQVISGDFEIDPDSGCPRVRETMTKRYVAETYAQSAVEGVIELAETHDVDPTEVEAIRLDTFAGAKLIIGGGEGSRYDVETRAQADHSLPYMLSAALIDRELTDESYDPERIRRNDVQRLLRTVEVEEDPDRTRRFESGEMPAIVEIELENGDVHRIEKSSFRGHPTDPMPWDVVVEKFERMVEDHWHPDHRDRVVETVRSLDERDVDELIALLD